MRLTRRGETLLILLTVVLLAVVLGVAAAVGQHWKRERLEHSGLIPPTSQTHQDYIRS